MRLVCRSAMVCLASAFLLTGAPPLLGGHDARLSLASLVATLEAQNPSVNSAAARWRAALKKRPQAVSLPDPRVEFMPFLRQMAEEEEKWILGTRLDIPHPRKRAVAGRIADREADVARLKFEMALRDAIAELKEVYFELYYIDRAMGVTAEVRKLYDRYAALAAGGVEPGGPRLPETFRAEAQRAQLDYDLVLLRQMRDTEAARLRAAAGLERGTPIGVTQEAHEPSGHLPRLEVLDRLVRAHSQELAAAGAEVERAREKVVEARLVRKPDFMVGAMYMRTGGQDLQEGDPTRDPIRLDLGVTLPIWDRKNRAVIDEARELEAAARTDLRAQDLKIDADLARAYFALSNSARLVVLYRNTLIPQSRQALQSAETLHRTGAASMLAVLETAATFHNFELARLRATADFYQNLARLERVVGTALVLPRPAAADATDRQGVPEGED